MKYNIRKFNYGGAVFTPIIDSMQTGSIPTKSATSDKDIDDDSDKSSIIDDDIMDALYSMTGLTNDVNTFISELAALERSSNLPFNNANNRAKALHIIAKTNELKNSKEYWKDAISRAKDSGGLGEVAVDSGGKVFVKTKDNKVVSISPDKYEEMKSNARLLSVQELMYERQQNPYLTGQNQVFTVADNAVGLEKISAHINNLISAFGSETDETTTVYGKRRAQEALLQMGAKEPSKQDYEAMKILTEIAQSSSNFSKVNIKNVSERNYLDRALKLVWNSLGTPAQTKLLAVSKLSGQKDPKEYILNMIVSGTSETKEVSVLPVKDEVATGESGENENDVKKVPLTYAELFHNDRMQIPGKTYTFNTNSGVYIDMKASASGALPSLTKSGEVLEAGVVSEILSVKNYKSILNPQEAYLGDDRVDPALLGELAYTGSDAAKVYAPVKADGSMDLGSMERFNALYEVFKENKDIWTPAQAEAYFAHNDFQGVKVSRVRDESGKPTLTIVTNQRVKPFLALPVITNSASELSDSPWMLKITGEEADTAEAIMEKAFTIYGGTASKPTQKVVAPSGWFSRERPYMGTLFIAYRPEAPAIISAAFGHLMGDSAQETDLRRNLSNSQNNSFSTVDANSKVIYDGY